MDSNDADLVDPTHTKVHVEYSGLAHSACQSQSRSFFPREYFCYGSSKVGKYKIQTDLPAHVTLPTAQPVAALGLFVISASSREGEGGREKRV